jgi:hypothetical protein
LLRAPNYPTWEPDDRLVIEPLAARGVRAEPAVRDDPEVDWAAYDLVVLRSPWDYVGRRETFVEWAGRVPRLANPADVVAWNTEKTYLERLAADGVPAVPSACCTPALTSLQDRTGLRCWSSWSSPSRHCSWTGPTARPRSAAGPAPAEGRPTRRRPGGPA